MFCVELKHQTLLLQFTCRIVSFISLPLPQLAGAAILGVGIWVKVDSGSVLSLLGKLQNAPAGLSQVLNVGYLLIAVGALLVIIGFLGCCGAVKESQCMLMLVRLSLLTSALPGSKMLLLKSHLKCVTCWFFLPVLHHSAAGVHSRGGRSHRDPGLQTFGELLENLFTQVILGTRFNWC